MQQRYASSTETYVSSSITFVVAEDCTAPGRARARGTGSGPAEPRGVDLYSGAAATTRKA